MNKLGNNPVGLENKHIIYGTRGGVASGGQSCICRMSCWVSLEGRKCSFLSTRLYIIWYMAHCHLPSYMDNYIHTYICMHVCECAYCLWGNRILQLYLEDMKLGRRSKCSAGDSGSLFLFLTMKMEHSWTRSSRNVSMAKENEMRQEVL